MSDKFGPSQMWQQILASIEADPDRPSSDLDWVERYNRHFAKWSPLTNGVRYAKTALALAVQALDERHMDVLRAIGNRRLPDPDEVKRDGLVINFDYLQVALEVVAMAPIASTAKTIAEIGAGYGRTCHGLLTANPSITTYRIVDLAPCLKQSHAYLQTVLPANVFAKVEFVPVEDLADGAALACDLAINIDSMAEMDAAVVQAYLNQIDANANAFFSKNPVGKYLPQCIGMDIDPAHPPLAAALRAGPLRDVIDIFDADAVAAKGPDFVAAYRPGDGWTCLADGFAPPWGYYWQALYQRQQS